MLKNTIWPCVKDKMWLYAEMLLSCKMSVQNLIDYSFGVTLNWTSFVARLILGLNLCSIYGFWNGMWHGGLHQRVATSLYQDKTVSQGWTGKSIGHIIHYNSQFSDISVLNNEQCWFIRAFGHIYIMMESKHGNVKSSYVDNHPEQLSKNFNST